MSKVTPEGNGVRGYKLRISVHDIARHGVQFGDGYVMYGDRHVLSVEEHNKITLVSVSGSTYGDLPCDFEVPKHAEVYVHWYPSFPNVSSKRV